MAGLQTIAGGCHCGAVRFEAKADFSKVVECNCSHCEKRGALLAFTAGENFRLVSDEAALGEYLFNTRTISHSFCTTCGVEAFARSADGVMINIRCIDGTDIAAPERIAFDGRSV